jgi:hypothetical protein
MWLSATWFLLIIYMTQVLHDTQMSLNMTKVLHDSHESLMLPKWYMNFSCQECYHSATGFSQVISVTKGLHESLLSLVATKVLHDSHISLMLRKCYMILTWHLSWTKRYTILTCQWCYQSTTWSSHVVSITKVLHDSHMLLIMTKVLHDSHMSLIVTKVLHHSQCH